MFANSAVNRRLAWIRGKVASSTGALKPHKFDVESGPSMGLQRFTKNRIVGHASQQRNIDRKNKGHSETPRLDYASSSSETSNFEDKTSLDQFSEKSTPNCRPRSRSLGSLSSHGQHENKNAKETQGHERDHTNRYENQVHENKDQNEIPQPEVLSHNPESNVETGKLYRLQSYLEQMYYVGVSPYHAKRQCGNANPGWPWLILHGLQKILFGIITVMSAWRSISNAKYCYLLFMSGVGLHNFVDFGFNFISFATKGQHVYTMIFKRKNVDKMLKTMSQYEEKYIIFGRSHDKRSKLSTALGIGTSVAVALRVCLHSGIFEWSLKDFVLGNSHEFTQDVFIWDHQNISLQADDLYAKYSVNITPVSVAFGTSTLVADLSSGIQMDALRDLLLLAASTIHFLVSAFIKKIEETMTNVPPDDMDAWKQLQVNREACWPMYRHVKEVVADANDVHDDMLKIMHVDNLLLYAHFVTMCITRSDTTLGNIIYHLWTLSKSEMTYYIAGSISGFNDPLRKWIRNWGCHTGKIQVGNEELDVNVVRDELTNEPLGFGKGNFLIRPTFHFKFLGLVGSFALFLADEKRKDE